MATTVITRSRNTCCSTSALFWATLMKVLLIAIPAFLSNGWVKVKARPPVQEGLNKNPLATF